MSHPPADQESVSAKDLGKAIQNLAFAAVAFATLMSLRLCTVIDSTLAIFSEMFTGPLPPITRVVYFLGYFNFAIASLPLVVVLIANRTMKIVPSLYVTAVMLFLSFGYYLLINEGVFYAPARAIIHQMQSGGAQ